MAALLNREIRNTLVTVGQKSVAMYSATSHRVKPGESQAEMYCVERQSLCGRSKSSPGGATKGKETNSA